MGLGYDDWKSGDYDDIGYECHLCDEHKESKEDAQIHFTALLKALYTFGPLDVEQLDKTLRHLCEYFDERCFNGLPTVQRFHNQDKERAA